MQQEGDGFEEMDSPGGSPWEQDLCDPPYASWSLTYDTGANTAGDLARVVEQDGAGALNKQRVHIQLPDGRESLVRELKSAFGRGNVTVDVDVSSKPSLGAKSAGRI